MGFLPCPPSNWQHPSWESAGAEEERHGGWWGAWAQDDLRFQMNPIGMDPDSSDQQGVYQEQQDRNPPSPTALQEPTDLWQETLINICNAAKML